MSSSETQSTATTRIKRYTFGEPWPQFNDGLTYRDSVRPSDSGMALIDFYSTKYKNSAPLPGWLQRIESGQITMDDRVVTDPNTVLRAASELVYHRLPWREPDAPYLLEVLFEDDHLMFIAGIKSSTRMIRLLRHRVEMLRPGTWKKVHAKRMSPFRVKKKIALNKPSGLQVLPGGLFQQRTVLTQLQWQASKQSSLFARQEMHPVPVHRLGRGTSGILLCAKTKLAKARISAYFADGTSVVGRNRNTDADVSKTGKISKMYRALASGILDENEVIINQPIGMLQYPGVAKGLYVASPSGKLALSKVRVLERDVQGNHTLVQVEIQSGRPHQIRIHLSFIGHPLIGDPLYVTGGQPKCFDPESLEESFAQDGGYQRPVNPVPGDCGYHLHAHRLVLSHPMTNDVMEIVAPLPLVLQSLEETKEIKPAFVEDVK